MIRSIRHKGLKRLFEQDDELVNGKRGISPEMAERLAKVFGGSEEGWLVQPNLRKVVLKPRELFRAVLLIMSCCSISSAFLLTYTEQAIASGQLGFASFALQPITLTLTGDTGAITQPIPGIYVELGTGILSIDGVGTADFTDVVQVVSNQVDQDAGFGDLTVFQAILFTGSSAFTSYDLQNPFGPVSGVAIFNPGTSFNTTAGGFRINSISGLSTFTATVPVPEPGEWLPVAFLLISVLIAARTLVQSIPKL